MNENFKTKVLYPILFIAFIGVVFYQNFIRHSNEIGFLGADKDGRQVFIQTLNKQLEPDMKVDSDFFEYNLLYRMLVQEPMRTVIKFDIQDKNKITVKQVDDYLNQPSSKFVEKFTDKVFMQEKYQVSPSDLTKQLDEKGVKTIEGLLAGFGFRQIEILENGKLVTTKEIQNTKNVFWAGF
ncbi:hypothetical protein HGA64_00815 [Candidatus Falkowbacteria bacterium]|nr:hypothetical protein [Candidatus Falkowbacteria bacterium]